MNLEKTLWKLLKRWYILLPGLMLAVGVAFGVWSSVPPKYERTSTQVLLPGTGSLPPDSANPYMFIGSLSLAADVVVRATGSENVAKEVEEGHPKVAFQVNRDPTTSGPVIRTTVSAPTDSEAGVVLELLTERTAAVLVELQDMEKIPQADRITVVTVTLDAQGLVSNRTRLILTGGSAVAVAGFSIFLAAMVEGVAAWRRVRSAGTVNSTTGDLDSSSEGELSGSVDAAATDLAGCAATQVAKRAQAPTSLVERQRAR